MADPAIRYPNYSKVPGDQGRSADNQQQTDHSPQAPRLTVQSSASSHLTSANSGTSHPASVSTPVQLTGAHTMASPPMDQALRKKQAMEFHAAAGQGDLTKVREMLAAGMPADSAKGPRIYAIAKAAQEGRLEVVRVLAENGAGDDSRTCGIAAAALCLWHDSTATDARECARYLIRSFPIGAARRTAIANAAHDMPEISPLLNSVCKEAEIEDFQQAARAGDIATLKAHIANGMNVSAQLTATAQTALVQAARKGRTDAVDYLLTQGPNFTDKKDALIAIAYELASSSDSGSKITHTAIAKSILKSAAVPEMLRDETIRSLRDPGDGEAANEIRKISF